MPDGSRRFRWTLLGLAVTVSVGIGVGFWYLLPHDAPPDPQPEVFAPDPPTPDPRLVFDTPFRNVKPDVRYVGDDACARCHLSITKSYHAHPMGRSAAFVPEPVPVEKYPASGKVAFTSGAFDLEAVKSDGRVRHSVRLREGDGTGRGPELVMSPRVAIGSGTRGRSYLAVEDGAVWQTAVSWFGPDERWDVSPGFRLGKSTRRPIQHGCLYCHVDAVRPVPGSDNRYEEPVFAGRLAIGCERCHGPGELHVAERAGGNLAAEIDTSIVNPKHLSPALRSAVCEQCHLQGEERVDRRGRDAFEYRPGLPFEQFVSVHVLHPALAAERKSVGQFEQMEQSRCFTGSGGRLGCTSCHDPHASHAPADRDAHYRARCLTCHQSDACAAPRPDRTARGDSCVACHMPKGASSNIIHASVTDHRVPRDPASRPPRQEYLPGSSPLVRFRDGPLSPPPEERERDLGIALAGLFKKRPPKSLSPRTDIRALAAERLRNSLQRWPGDADAWVSLGAVKTEASQSAERLRAAKAAVALAPQSEDALAALTEAATAVGDLELAEATANDWVRLNPGGFDPLVGRAFVHLARADWAKAELDALAALRRQPVHPEARLYLAICLHKKGDRSGAAAELELAARAESDLRERQYLLDWYRRATR